MSTLRAYLGVAGLADVGLQYYLRNAVVGARLTPALDEGEGWYSLDVGTLPLESVADQVRWDSLSDSSARARENLAPYQLAVTIAAIKVEVEEDFDTGGITPPITPPSGGPPSTDPSDLATVPNGLIRTVNFRRGILYPMARAIGLEPERNFPPSEAAALVDGINSRVRYARNFWQWPELQITEERAFRQVWNPHLTYRGGIDEVYFLDDQQYYRALVDTAAGETPATAPAKWTAITLLDRYLAYDQFGKQSIGKVISINQLDPRLYRPFERAYSGSPSGFGVDLSRYAVGPTVWVTYEPRQPEFTHEQYDPGYAYTKGMLIFEPETGECYRALRDGTDEPPETSGIYWLMQQMPYLLSEYVKTGEVGVLQQMVDGILEQSLPNYYARRTAGGYPQIGFGPFTPWLVEVPVLQPS